MDIPRPKPKKTKRNVLLAAAAVGLLGFTYFLSTLKAAAPTVEKAAVWTDTVTRGPMLRQVKGPGTLVPEQVRWLTANTAGRVERIHVKAGERIEAATVLMELANPDVQLQALEAERQLASAKADLLNLKMRLEADALNARSAYAQVKAQAAEADRQAEATKALLDKEVISRVEAANAADRETETKARLEYEQRRVAMLSEGARAQIAAQEGQIRRLQDVARFRKEQVDGMKVTSPEAGLLTEVRVEPGQWVVPGTILARVVQPERLKAELRVAETQAKDVTLDQRVEVDTRNGIVEGKVARIAPAASCGTVLVEVALDNGQLPKGARPDLTVEGTIELERLPNVLSVGRPAGAQGGATVTLFKMTPGSDEAIRVPVQLGRTSVHRVEVVGGLTEGDQVVLSDMSQWDSVERVRLR